MKRLVKLADSISLFVRERKAWMNFLFGMIDLMVLTIAFQISYSIFNNVEMSLFIGDASYLILYLILVPTWMMMLQASNISKIPRTRGKWQMLNEFLHFSFLHLVIIIAFSFILEQNTESFLFLFSVVFIGMILLLIVRINEFKILRWYRRIGHNHLNISIIADESAIDFIQKLIDRKEWGYNLIYIYTDSELVYREFQDQAKILPLKAVKSLNTLMELNIVDEIFCYQKNVPMNEVRELIYTCQEMGKIFRLRSAENSNEYITNAVPSFVGSISFMTFVNVPTNSFWLAFKTSLDIYATAIMLFILFPVFLVIGILIKLSSPGPVIFKQARVGLRGRQFYIYKFRTMVVNAEELRKKLEASNEMDGPVFKIKNDPRITSIGRFLRKTGLDELPQLINVLKGEMSLIGPRPPLPSETVQYERWQLRRLSVKPGITCSWQISPNRNNIRFEQWMKLDLKYIDNWSPKQDILLLFRTFGTVVNKSGS